LVFAPNEALIDLILVLRSPPTPDYRDQDYGTSAAEADHDTASGAQSGKVQ